VTQKTVRNVAAITGGCSGVGFQTARHFASLGWDVSICGRDKAGVEFATKALKLESRVQVVGVSADVTSEIEMQDFAKQTADTLGSVDTLICNAAVLGPVGKVSNVSISEVLNTFAINVVGAYNTVSKFWDQLSTSPNPRVVTISGGGLGGPNHIQMAPSYVPSKSALASFTEILSEEMRMINGSAISVALGNVIPTKFLDGAIKVGIGVAGKRLFDEAILQQNSQIEGSLDDFCALLDYLMTEDGLSLNGAMLSAKWNKIAELKIQIQKGLEPNMFRLRRIDGQLFEGKK
jgi:NAD(P)-dependent dehydrogenase (short-subunit alcohol dehydrogenase family)